MAKPFTIHVKAIPAPGSDMCSRRARGWKLLRSLRQNLEQRAQVDAPVLGGILGIACPGTPGFRLDAVSSGGNSTSVLRNSQDRLLAIVAQGHEGIFRCLSLAPMAENHFLQVDAAAVVAVGCVLLPTPHSGSVMNRVISVPLYCRSWNAGPRS